MRTVLKIFILTIVLSATATSVAKPVHAANITVDCASNDCVMSPTPNEALFGEFEDLNFDLKPGDKIKRTITVNNNTDEICYLYLGGQTINLQTPENFAEELYTALKNNGNDIYGASSGDMALTVNTLQQLLSGSEIYMGPINPSSSELFDWLVYFNILAGNEFQNARLEFDFDLTFNCGDEPEFGTDLIISKSNNRFPQVLQTGDDVVYTLIVTATENVDNVIVIDLPPGGFNYVGGSWTASSNVRGDIKNSPTTEPTYASPGTWILGDMQAEEVVTLTYRTIIEDTVENGLYPDLAYTEGEEPETANRVVGNDDSGVFVGTQVEVSNDPESPSVDVEVEQVEIEEEVLGAASVLPETGVANFWLAIAAVLAAFGLLIIFADKIKRKLPQIFTFFVVLGLFVAFSGQVSAANLSVRLAEIESPTNLDSFRINFVVLDTETRTVEVKCYRKAPSAAVFSNFETKSLIPGGDDDYCNVTEPLLGEDGIYKYYVTAEAGADFATSLTSSVEYDTENPGKPKNLEKDRKNSCEYEISFKTADDGGETTRAEVYHSKDKEFEVNSGTLTHNVNVGSNTKVTFTDTTPDCGKSYYYAVRAFDAAGNPSSVLTEEDVTIVTTTTVEGETVITTAQVASDATVGVPGEGAAGEGEGIGEETGEIAGETDEDDESAIEDNDEGTEEDVLGAEDEQSAISRFVSDNFAILILLGLGVIILIVWLVRRKN